MEMASPGWTQLIMACPVQGCPGRKEVGRWQCGQCQGQMYISENGVIECQAGTHTGRMNTWRFDCGCSDRYNPHSNGGSRYKTGNWQGFSDAFSAAMALGFLSQRGEQWVQQLLQSLQDQLPRYWYG